MHEVLSDRFYKIIGPLDVTVSAVGDRYPYKAVFRLRNGTLVGYEEHGHYFVGKEYIENAED